MAIPSTSTCKYMVQFLWGQNGCIVPDGVPMMHGAAKLPVKSYWIVRNKWVKGVYHDWCSSPFGSHPGGHDFRHACAMHDYGYGIIYYSKTDTYWTSAKAHAADSVFYTTLRDYVCTRYLSTSSKRKSCLKWARTYYLGVKFGGGWEM
ncbi:phospholipase A2 [Nonomuraea dietziae]|uniref:phospholipase A2 n=1 Tax=Nonomuraea dietziae TaxID=65515 RepID=UPI0033E8A2C5